MKMRDEMKGTITRGTATIANKDPNMTPIRDLKSRQEHQKQGMCKPNEKVIPGVNACSKIEDWEKDENFKKAMKFIKKAEGGYSNRKNDKGGETSLGITQNTYNEYNDKRKLSRKSVKELTEKDSMKIYYEYFWLKSGADKLDDKALGLMLFDTAVNHGVGGAKKYYKESQGNLDNLAQIRKNYYKNRVKEKPDQAEFLNGWLNRMDRIQQFINENYR